MRVGLIAVNITNLMAIDDTVFVSCDCSDVCSLNDLRYANGYVCNMFIP